MLAALMHLLNQRDNRASCSCSVVILTGNEISLNSYSLWRSQNEPYVVLAQIWWLFVFRLDVGCWTRDIL